MDETCPVSTGGMYIRGCGAVWRAHVAEPGGGEVAQRMRARRRGVRAGAGPRVWCRPGAKLPGDTHDTHGTPALCHAAQSCASARGRRPAMRSQADALNFSTRYAPRARAARHPPPEACPPWLSAARRRSNGSNSPRALARPLAAGRAHGRAHVRKVLVVRAALGSHRNLFRTRAKVSAATARRAGATSAELLRQPARGRGAGGRC
jgi:hypothetical protein